MLLLFAHSQNILTRDIAMKKIFQKLTVVLLILSLGLVGFADHGVNVSHVVSGPKLKPKLVSESGIGKVTGTFRSTYKGDTTYRTTGGVLFQATASPGDSIPKDALIQLSYQIKNAWETKYDNMFTNETTDSTERKKAVRETYDKLMKLLTYELGFTLSPDRNETQTIVELPRRDAVAIQER